MPQVLVAISQKFYCRKEALGYTKVIHKKRREKKKRDEKKWTSVRDIEKQWVLKYPPEKREMNKIAHVLLQKCFQVSKERYVFKEQNRIRLATIYIHHIHPHICTSWFDCMTQLCLDPLFDFTIYALQVCSSFLPTYELHISHSGRKRKRHNIFIASVRIHKYHIYWETWECHTKEALSFILKIYKKTSE